MPEVKTEERLELSSRDQSGTGARGEPQTFYRYEDKGGKVIIVDSLAKLPPDARERAERLELGVPRPSPPSHEVAAIVPGAAEVNVAPGARATVTSEQPATKSVGLVDGASAQRVGSRFEFQPASFGLGLGAGLLLALALLFLAGRSEGSGWSRWIMRSALLTGLVLLGSSAYLGWSRQHAGLGDSALASPQDLIQDARGAVEQVKQRRAEQEQALEEPERLAN